MDKYLLSLKSWSPHVERMIGAIYSENSPLHVATAIALLESHGDRPYGAWMTEVDHELDAAVLAAALGVLVAALPEESIRGTLSSLFWQLFGHSELREPESHTQEDFSLLSVVDRRRMVDKIVGLDPAKVLTKPKDGSRPKFTAAALKSIVNILKQRVSIDAVGKNFLRYGDGELTKTLAGRKVPLNPQAFAHVAAFTEAAIKATSISIPKQIQRAPATDSDAAEITHDLSNRIVVVTRKSSPEVVSEIAAGETHTVKASDLLYGHALTVKRAPKKATT